MFYEYKMNHKFVGRFKGGYFEQKDQARREFSNKWYNLRRNTSLDRIFRKQTNNTNNTMDDLSKADELENQSNNFIIEGEI